MTRPRPSRARSHHPPPLDTTGAPRADTDDTSGCLGEVDGLAVAQHVSALFEPCAFHLKGVRHLVLPLEGANGRTVKRPFPSAPAT